MVRATAQDNVPVTLLTGFLGSGKTTLLRRALADPGFADTAVVINEIGEIAIDHYLVDFVAGDVIELPGGCLCCAVREDLAQTLRSLVVRRDAGEIRAFRRLVVETTGLADPAPILFTFGADPMLDQRLRLERVVTVVDAMTGLATIERFPEAARQVAVADALYISKTDLAPLSNELATRLRALAPGAESIYGAEAQDPARVLFAPQDPHPALPRLRGRGRMAAASVALPPPQAGEGWGGGGPPPSQPHAVHSHGITSFTIVLRQPTGMLDFAMALGGLAQARGNDLLRVKGLVAFAERPGRPAVVQAAQHAMATPQWLDDWPDQDRRSRLVFIVHDMAPAEILDRFAFAAPSLLQAPGPRAGGDPSGHRHVG